MYEIQLENESLHAITLAVALLVHLCILPHVWMTTGRVLICNWIYWPLTIVTAINNNISWIYSLQFTMANLVLLSQLCLHQFSSNGLQQWILQFLFVPKLSMLHSHSNSQLTPTILLTCQEDWLYIIYLHHSRRQSLYILYCVQNQSHITIDTLSWCQHLSVNCNQFFSLITFFTVAFLMMRGTLSDERMDL